MIRAYIQDILNEWAIRSDDGLSFGHTTTANIAVLDGILTERGLDQNARVEILSQIMVAHKETAA